MGKTPKKVSARRLADMGTEPVPESPYVPPPAAACSEDVFPVMITEADRFHVRLRSYRGKIVDFAITQLTTVDGVGEVTVARIDCCHGSVHRHQFNREGDDIYDHRVIRAIPLKGWDVVDEAYTEAYETMFNEWDENLRRWRG